MSAKWESAASGDPRSIRQSIHKVEAAGKQQGCQTLQAADAEEKPPLYRIRAAFSRSDTASTRLAFFEFFAVV